MSGHAYLEIFIGSMMSGKTSKLIEIYKQNTYCNRKAYVLNHSWDNRYSETELVSHDGIKIPCHRSTTLAEVLGNEDLLASEVVLINEGQFFVDLVDGVKQLLDLGKAVYVAGLDGDFQRKAIGHILELIPLCDNVVKLTSLCSQCRNGEPGIFSKRLTSSTSQIEIGTDIYQPMCRSCYER
jgi:thymidine kinase